MGIDAASLNGGPAPHDSVPQPVDRILRAKVVCELTGLGKSTLYRRSREGSFPPARRISENAVGWRLSEVNAWIEGLPVIAPSGLRPG